MKEHLLRLSPGAVDDDDIMFYSPCFFGFNQFLQVLRLWTWKQNYCPAVPAHGSQLWMPEQKEVYLRICVAIGWFFFWSETKGKCLNGISSYTKYKWSMKKGSCKLKLFIHFTSKRHTLLFFFLPPKQLLPFFTKPPSNNHIAFPFRQTSSKQWYCTEYSALLTTQEIFDILVTTTKKTGH